MTDLYLTATAQTGVTSAAETTRHTLEFLPGVVSTMRNKNTSAAPASPVKMTDSAVAGTDGNTIAWYSMPLAPVTIAGQMAWALWCRESSTSANAAPTIGVYRCSAVGVELATIVDPSLTRSSLEMSTTVGGVSSSITIPASSVVDTAIGDGERIKVALFIDNAVDQGGSGSMASGFNCQFWVNGPTGVAGQSRISFSETILAQQPGILGSLVRASRQANFQAAQLYG